MKKFPGWPRKVSIMIFWLLLWQAAAMGIRNEIFLVGPAETLLALWGQLGQPGFWQAAAFSVGRIGLGFFAAFFAGLFTGAVSYAHPLMGEFLETPIQFMKSIPVASFVILALIWTGSRNLSVFIAFMVVYPMIHLATAAGLQSADPKLLEMARVFRVPLWRRALFLYRPALFPYLQNACRTALGMGFKSGIAAEVIGVPAGSIGEGLYMAKIYLSTAELFAWTLAIVVISVLFEKTVLFFLQWLAFLGTPGNGQEKSGQEKSGQEKTRGEKRVEERGRDYGRGERL